MIRVCPMPGHWAAIHEKLLKHHKGSSGALEDQPPGPLVFDGWYWSSDVEKHARWIEMQERADQHGCLALTQEVPRDEWYCVAEMADRVQDPFNEGL